MLPGAARVALAPLLSRRSVSALVGPAPTAQEIDAILQAAVTVPDHGGLRPWRLVVARARLAPRSVIARRHPRGERLPDLSEATLQRSPEGVRGAHAHHGGGAPGPGTPRPRWEHVASAACVGYAITLAAHQLGLGAMWKSIPFVTAPRCAECSTWRRTTSSSAGSTSATPRPTTTPTTRARHRPHADRTSPRRRRAPRPLPGRELNYDAT